MNQYRHYSDYGPNRQYYEQIYNSGSSTEKTIYAGGLLEKVTVGSLVDWRHYIRVNNELVAIVSRQSSGTNATHYMLSDHEGSIAAITDASAATTVSESFSAYGTRRAPATWSGTPTCPDLCAMTAITREGYTGHDAMGGVSMGLNHMNGRVQDAITGRFLSPDPTTLNPGNTQSWNRYSYVNNNPLTATDPTGFFDMTCSPDGGCGGSGGVAGLPEQSQWSCYGGGCSGGGWANSIQTGGSSTTPINPIAAFNNWVAAVAPATANTQNSDPNSNWENNNNVNVQAAQSQTSQGGAPIDLSPSSDGLDPVVVTGARYVLADLSPWTFYQHFLDGTGTTVVLTTSQFYRVANLGKVVATAPSKDGSYAQLRSYYGVHDDSGSNLGLTFGSAVVNVDDNFFPLGFSDFYDFDFHSRSSSFAQFMTGVGFTGYLLGGKDFAITYP